MNNNSANEQRKIIVALDYSDIQDAIEMASKLSPSLCRLKVGKELFTSGGPKLVEMLQKQNYDVFLDLKFHDIPNTTAKAVTAAGSLGVWMVNVHASGGERMLTAAMEALQSFKERPMLTAVTVLTSLSEEQLPAVGVHQSVEQQVLTLATLTQQSGLDGVVCSAVEAKMLREAMGPKFCLVTPGIRPAGAAQDDQVRIVTPTQAVEWGSDYLVMGRPIRNNPDPCQLLTTLNSELDQL
ncbi:MAG: orotidine-5'-phosphate decarboxylase [Pseudomonadota bacterium]